MLNIASFFNHKNLTLGLFLHIFLIIIIASSTKADVFASPTYDEGIDYKRIYSENNYKKTKNSSNKIDHLRTSSISSLIVGGANTSSASLRPMRRAKTPRNAVHNADKPKIIRPAIQSD